MTQPVFRFAPSPNGELHLGHAYSALLNHDLCRRAGGRFLLRIEDIDAARSRPAFEEGIKQDLAWLGIAWEEPVRRQSENMDAYCSALARLQDRGFLYPAFMSRGEIAAAAAGPGWPRDPDGAPLYPGDDRQRDPHEVEERILAGVPHALRLRTAEATAAAGPLVWDERGSGAARPVAADPAAWGDVVVARKDTPASYHLAVVVDDADQGVTHVVRGNDLFAATSVHVLLQRLLGLPSPVYHHHRLITDAGGRKLAKSAGDTGLRVLREAGATAADIRRLVGFRRHDEVGE